MQLRSSTLYSKGKSVQKSGWLYSRHILDRNQGFWLEIIVQIDFRLILGKYWLSEPKNTGIERHENLLNCKISRTKLDKHPSEMNLLYWSCFRLREGLSWDHFLHYILRTQRFIFFLRVGRGTKKNMYSRSNTLMKEKIYINYICLIGCFFMVRFWGFLFGINRARPLLTYRLISFLIISTLNYLKLSFKEMRISVTISYESWNTPSALNLVTL